MVVGETSTKRVRSTRKRRASPRPRAGAVLGGVVGGGIYAFTTETFSVRGLLGAVVGGAVAGAVGTIAAPIAAELGLGTGVLGAAAVNASAGAAAAAVNAAIDPCLSLSVEVLASAAGFGAFGGAAGNRLFPAQGMSRFGQVGFPRTLRGVIPTPFGGTAGPNALNALYRGGTVAGFIGAAGPTLGQ